MTRKIMGVELVGWRAGGTLNMAASEDDGVKLAMVAAVLRTQGWDAKVVAARYEDGTPCGFFNLEATARA